MFDGGAWGARKWARVGGLLPHSLGNLTKTLSIIWEAFFLLFLYTGAFTLRFSCQGGGRWLFSLWGAFLPLFSPYRGVFLWHAPSPPPLTKISAGAHAEWRDFIKYCQHL